jgi:WD40 repeat protein
MKSLILRGVAASLLSALGLMQFSIAAAVAPPPEDPFLVIDAGSHTGAINRIAADSRCSLLATASDDKTVRVWSVGGGDRAGIALVRTLRPAFTAGSGALFAVALSPDGRLVAAAGDTGSGANGWFGFVFDSVTGSMTKLLGPFPKQILRLAFSPGGEYLAATFKSGEGLRVWRTSDWSETYKDDSYGDHTYGLAFDKEGGIFTASYDGFIRHYGAGMELNAKFSAEGGPKPFSVSINPASGALAAGFQGQNAVGIFGQTSSGSLALSQRLAGGDGTLRTVAWSADGQGLFAAGQYAQGGKYLVRSWKDGEWDGGRDIDVSGGDEVEDLIRCGQNFAYSTEGGAFGIFDTGGNRLQFQERGAIDMRHVKGKSFTISRDSLRVRFGLGGIGSRYAIFDAIRESLEPSATNPPDLISADTSSLDIQDWDVSLTPSLGGKPLQLNGAERALSAAVSPNKDSFFLGSDFALRKYDAAAKGILGIDPGAASPWGLNASQDGRYIVAASEDGTVRWYRQDNLKEVVALFVQPHDGRWILWTPQGYYLASRGGEELIGWQVNRGWDKGADFFPATKFRNRFYRPDIVRAAFQLADAEKAGGLANRKAGAKPVPQDIRRALPPVLTIVEPITEGSFESKDFRLTYEVRSPTGEPVSGVRVLLDGEVPGGSKGFIPVANAAWSPDKTIRRSIDLSLPQRDVTVTLFADSENGSSEKKSIRLHWAAPKVPVPSSLPVLKAVIAGINSYKAQSLSLKWAVQDARDLDETFRKEEGRTYSRVETRILPDATRASLARELGWLRQDPLNVPESGVIRILYLSGHGTDSNQRFYFLTSDADISDIEATAISDSDITGWVRNTTGKKIIFLDACRSANGLALPGGLAFPDYNKLSNDVRSVHEGTIVYASSGRNELSYESPDWGHGAFTKVLLEGLKGGADPYKTGEIETDALALHLKVNVGKLTAGKQIPIWSHSDLSPPFALAKDP